MFEPPLHLRPGHGLVAEVVHRRADPLRGEQGAQHALDPIHRADILFWPRPLAPYRCRVLKSEPFFWEDNGSPTSHHSRRLL